MHCRYKFAVGSRIFFTALKNLLLAAYCIHTLSAQIDLTQVSITYVQLKIQLQLCVFSKPNLNIMLIYSKYAELCI